MQPYFFPYLGYWQLIAAVDVYVVYDDVNFVKRSYINRNEILNGQDRQRFTLEVLNVKSDEKINNILVGTNKHKLIKTLQRNYSRAPNFSEAFALLHRILSQPEKNLAKFLAYSISEICNYLNIKTQLIISSSINKNESLKGQEKIIDICSILNVDHYINAIGGVDLYSKDEFSKKNIKLNFLDPETKAYAQFKEPFQKNLSIIDVLMFVNRFEVKQYLTSYKLI